MQKFIPNALVLGLLIAAFGVQAQLPLVWTNQEKTTILEYWYPNGNLDSVKLWTSQEIWHDTKGRPLLGVLEGKEGNNQRVNLRYNEQGDLEERIHRMEDSTELIFTWKHKYDDQGRMTEETSFDHEDKLISQLVMVYDEAGRLQDQAMYVRRLPEYQSWQFLDDETGLKTHDARLLAYGPRHFYFNWSERIFLEYLNPFSLLPSEDVFQRYHFTYNDQGKLAKTELFDQMRNMLEEDEFFYDNKGRERSLKSKMPFDSLNLVWDYQYGDHGEIKLSRYVNMEDNYIEQIFKTELVMDGDRIAERRNTKIKNLQEIYFYNESNVLTKRERRDIFGSLLESWTYAPDGRLTESRKYIDDEVMEVLRKYSYEP